MARGVLPLRLARAVGERGWLRPVRVVGQAAKLSDIAQSVERTVLHLCEQHGATASLQSAFSDLTIKSRVSQLPSIDGARPAVDHDAQHMTPYTRLPPPLWFIFLAQPIPPHFPPSQLLSACERKFGCAIPNASLASLKTAEDAIKYFESRMNQRSEQQAAVDSHWSRNLPPNVTLDEEGVLSLDGKVDRGFKIKPRRHNDEMGLR
eukprot:scaffold273479_cov33-Tisochrysis_lutea.AAC.1